ERCDDHRTGAPADREERLLRDPRPVQGQGLAGALRGQDAQAPDRHPEPDAEDDRSAHAARSPGGNRPRDQALMATSILGRKLGMTQIFDPETGAVTGVTVIAAGPCPVVQVKTTATDGYDAVQLAFDPVADWKLTQPEAGHLKKFGVRPHRTLVEFRGGIEGAG